MDSKMAINILESLRSGLPPTGYIRYLTVGRKAEIDDLTRILRTKQSGVLLLHANYGSGKSHLLHFIREAALEAGFAVSLVTLNAKSAIRFDRMNQIFGAICRTIEIPGKSERGVHTLFDRFFLPTNTHPLTARISNNRRWNEQDIFDGDILYVALRAYGYFKHSLWGDSHRLCAEISDWLCTADESKYTPTYVYQQFVEQLRPRYNDPRDKRTFTRNELFKFKALNYHNSWLAFSDLYLLTEATGLKGLILLFDEFEDVLTNITRVDQQEEVFRNLFTFYAGRKFPGLSFYAVTPDFANKCKRRLREKRGWDIDLPAFNDLPIFAMSPLDNADLESLMLKIVDMYGIAHQWHPDPTWINTELRRIVKKGANSTAPDRVRQTIRQVLDSLDDQLEDRL